MSYQNTLESTAIIDIEAYAYLVKRIALHLKARLPASVLLDDLIQSGLLGLLEAAQKFDGSKGASFETYAGIRIRGAMVDEMRKGDWVPRSVHRNARKISQAMKTLEARLGREASDAELAEAMNLSLSEYHTMANDCLGGRLFSLDETFEEENINSDDLHTNTSLQSPAELIQRDAMQTALSQAIDQLPEREKLVLSLYYEQSLNLKEIGLVMGVSESRVSQIHSQAALRLKKKLIDW